MIKILKLQKAVIAFILGVLALIAYKIMMANKIESSNYVLSLSGLLFMAGALMFIYPILFAKKVKEGQVELEPDKQEDLDTEKVAETPAEG
ncbi:isoleucyl-tRNA synthetase [Pedobacter metabolipauper]|uniref:Isoleucyl-tRNA synthetase n=1 Tax=Pedobacter metabolipauper TaxID=425513 RepID=A0A4R6ST69_9SPHI|nr:isoleucyl-tRNA synthetase [Pedobacter metabolipauper]TDQ06694.1 hypothetical protein ATK78_4353 [Pedobacter metabolipauper]